MFQISMFQPRSGERKRLKKLMHFFYDFSVQRGTKLVGCQTLHFSIRDIVNWNSFSLPPYLMLVVLINTPASATPLSSCEKHSTPY